MFFARSNRADPKIAELIAGIDEPLVRQHVQRLAGLGPRSVDDADSVIGAIAYLKSALEGFGYKVDLEPFGTEPYEVNLVAELRGASISDRVFELGAHYDTVRGSPGADDNASGVAGVLAVAEILKRAAIRRTIRFCLFGAEESGLRGSYAHVRAIRENTHQRVEGIAVFEMIGYRTQAPKSQRTPVRIPLVIWPPRTGDFIAVVSNFRSRRIAIRFEQAAARYVPELRVYAVKRLGDFFRDATRSDHLPYWRNRLSGVMITDTANFRNPNYHKPTDTAETLDYEFLVSVSRTAAAMLLEWACESDG
jgi:Zn-dependent M28 family amino/carboxypeptidase